MMVWYLTGSKCIVSLLNKFGHCAMPSTIYSFNTALAQIQINQGKVCVPSESNILICDKIDFCEDAQTGQSTTHHTNGPMIQLKQVSAPLDSVKICVYHSKINKVNEKVL